jgi:hypothetical protein
MERLTPRREADACWLFGPGLSRSRSGENTRPHLTGTGDRAGYLLQLNWAKRHGGVT